MLNFWLVKLIPIFCGFILFIRNCQVINVSLQLIIKHTITHGITPPLCSCGNGFIELRQAGKTAKNAGRYYYKCLLNDDHRWSFKWFDEVPMFAEDALNVNSTHGSRPPTTTQTLTLPTTMTVVVNRVLCAARLHAMQAFSYFLYLLWRNGHMCNECTTCNQPPCKWCG